MMASISFESPSCAEFDPAREDENPASMVFRCVSFRRYSTWRRIELQAL
jgi:hypothetical protein